MSSIQETLKKNNISYTYNEDRSEIIIDTGVLHDIKICDNILEVYVNIRAGSFEYMDEMLPRIDREREMLDFIEAEVEELFVDLGYERNFYSLSGDDEYNEDDIFHVCFQNELHQGRLSVSRLKKTLRCLRSTHLNRSHYSCF